LAICGSKSVVGLEYLAGLFYCADRESAEGGQTINGELPHQGQEVSRDVWRAIK
jgi:hypothetical protein